MYELGGDTIQFIAKSMAKLVALPLKNNSGEME